VLKDALYRGVMGVLKRLEARKRDAAQ